jgi:hypothetical protein
MEGIISSRSKYLFQGYKLTCIEMCIGTEKLVCYTEVLLYTGYALLDDYLLRLKLVNLTIYYVNYALTPYLFTH